MPLIKSLGSIKICMYFRDHNPPHFHILYAEYEELITISTLTTYAGKVPAAQRKKVISWAQENQQFLIGQWNILNPPKE
ncbi:MAG: DUF4160 domain-containing protein [Bacteroidia bacterium]